MWDPPKHPQTAKFTLLYPTRMPILIMDPQCNILESKGAEDRFQDPLTRLFARSSPLDEGINSASMGYLQIDRQDRKAMATEDGKKLNSKVIPLALRLHQRHAPIHGCSCHWRLQTTRHIPTNTIHPTAGKNILRYMGRPKFSTHNPCPKDMEWPHP